MKLKQLRLFNEIYATGSLTAAAERLFVSQPAASKILANLEEDVGYELFFRKGGKLQATPEANLLHEEVRSTLQSIDQLENSFRRTGRGARGEIKIASITGPALGYLPDLICRFQREHEDTKIILRIRNSLSIRELVATGQVDIGLADLGLWTNRYDMTPVAMRCYCALHRSHPLASQARVGPKMLGAINWITCSPEHETYHKLKAAYQEHRVEFRSNLTVESTILALEMVARNVGAAIVDPLTCHLFEKDVGLQFPNVTLVPFEPIILESVDIISQNSRPMSNVASLFLKTLRSEIAQFATPG